MTEQPVQARQHQQDVKVQNYELILASGSPRRQQLLAGLGLQFRTVVSQAPETVSSELSPGELVETLARRKAEHVHALLKHTEANHDFGASPADGSHDRVILAADTIVVRNGTVLGKPVDEEHAIRTLESLQGQEHTVFTGVCVMSSTSEKLRVRHSSTRVFMRELSREQIVRYVNTGEPMDKAGAYGIQGFGATLVESIHGDYFTVVGLPLALTTDLLEEFGISIWPSSR